MSADAAGLPAPNERDTTLLTTDLIVGGMTCAACVARVEKRLARLDGVTAGVNLATGRARVLHPPGVALDDLVAAVERAGYTAQPAADPTDSVPDTEAAGEQEAGRVRHLLGVATLAVPVIVLSMVPGLQFRNWQWLCFALAVPVVSWGALVFHQQAWAGLRHATATMDTLVSLGVAASFGWSVYALFAGGAGQPGMRMGFSLTAGTGGGAPVYLEAAVAVPLFVLTGRLLESRARNRTGSALRSLAELGVKDVCLWQDGQERTVPIDRLLPGDEFVVRPGEQVATDGVVVEGSSALDLSMLTGESIPVEAGPGDPVAGATLNVGGTLVVRATAVGADTQLARITALVTDAQAGKARAQRLADAVAGVFVPVVLAIAVCVLGFWLGAGATAPDAVAASVAVLVVACPCALGLATPTALLAATGRGAQLGILVRGPEALESLRRVDTVVLDKTGTLTSGRMELLATTAATGQDPQLLLRLAGAVEHHSEHPIGRAIAAAARRETDTSLPEAVGFHATAGRGVSAQVQGHQVHIERPDQHPVLPAELSTALETAHQAGNTAVVVDVDGDPVAVLAVGDRVRPGSWRAVHRLKRLGLRPVLVTGDQDGAARAVATELGIAEIHAAITPEGKQRIVAELQRAGRVVAVVGDGVNDTVALATADLGIAVGSGTDAAIGAAGITLVHGDIEALPDAVRLARRTLGTIRANLVWAFGYNLLLIPLAALGLLNPMLAAAAMSASSVLVVANSLRLRTWRPHPVSGPRRGGSRNRGPALWGDTAPPAARGYGTDHPGSRTGDHTAIGRPLPALSDAPDDQPQETPHNAPADGRPDAADSASGGQLADEVDELEMLELEREAAELEASGATLTKHRRRRLLLIPSAALLTALLLVLGGRAAFAGHRTPGLPIVGMVDAYLKPPTGGELHAYLIIRNAGDAPDRLLGVSTPSATRAGLVTATGSALPGITIPAHSAVSLDPSGDSIVLSELTQPVKAGATIPLDLKFATSGTVYMFAPVGPPGSLTMQGVMQATMSEPDAMRHGMTPQQMKDMGQ